MVESTVSAPAAEAAWMLLRELAPALQIESGWQRPIALAIGGQLQPAVCRVVTYGSMIDARVADRLAARANSLPAPTLEVRCLVCCRCRRLEQPAGSDRSGALRWRDTDLVLPQMCIVGDALLFVEDPADGVVRCVDSPMISLLVAIFDAIWAGTGSVEDEPVRGGLPGDLQEVVEQLATGSTDRTAQRNTNLSPRTFSRKVAEVMRLLGARSRFQAGVEAAHRGWIRRPS